MAADLNIDRQNVREKVDKWKFCLSSTEDVKWKTDEWHVERGTVSQRKYRESTENDRWQVDAILVSSWLEIEIKRNSKQTI